MSGQLIVPSRFAEGKPGRRQVQNPFARVARAVRQHRATSRPVWKYDGSDPIRPAPGRKVGRPAGGWIDDLVSLRKVLVLCWRCEPKFYYKRARYYKDQVFPHASGNCNGCREWAVQGRLFIPEERLTEPGGKTRPGQCWTPR